MVSDRYFGLSVIAVAVFYLYSSSNIQSGFLPDPVGSKTFPYIVGSIALLCGILIILKPDPNPVWPGYSTFARILLAVAVMYMFATTLRPVGFIIPSFIGSGIISYLIFPNIMRNILAGAGLSIGLFIVLKYGLGLGLSAFGPLLSG